MIYTVTFNPSLDYVITVEDFRTGIVNRTENECIFPGGKGINVSMVLSNLGLQSTALGFVAGFTGEKLQELLKEKQIVTDFIRTDNGMSRINVKLRSVKNGKRTEETEINGQGPEIRNTDIDLLYKKMDGLKSEDILVLAGSAPKCMPDTIYMDIMEYLQNKDVRIVVDATKELLLNVLKYKPFLIKPNNHELGEVFGKTLITSEEIIACAKELQRKGARNVLVSMAGDGAILVAEDGSVFVAKAPEGTVRNSIGAGDSMVAGFVTGYLKTGSYKEALLYGLCTGSASAFSEELATKEEVEKLLQQRNDFLQK